jgi:putative hydrolase of the HAD superfamily
MKKYKAVFFDLDHTLWDFDRNSEVTLKELFLSHKLEEKGVTGFDEFLSTYRQINAEMWDSYNRHEITTEQLRNGRFSRTLERFKISDSKTAAALSVEYLAISPTKSYLLPGSVEVLEYLSGKYSLHIITNGFREVQHIKIANSGIKSFFSHIHISEEIGFRKPHRSIFEHAVDSAGTIRDHCIMIGDNLEADIDGALNAGIDAVFFNPSGIEHGRRNLREIKSLDQLMNFL